MFRSWQSMCFLKQRTSMGWFWPVHILYTKAILQFGNLPYPLKTPSLYMCCSLCLVCLPTLTVNPYSSCKTLLRNYPGRPRWLSDEESAGQSRRCRFPGLGRSSGEGTSNPLQYSCLENPDRGAWWATVHSKELDTAEVTEHVLYLKPSCLLSWLFSPSLFCPGSMRVYGRFQMWLL